MIDPTNITNYNLTQAELEEHILFWVFAAGHNAKSTAKGIEKFLTLLNYDRSLVHDIRPFHWIMLQGHATSWEHIVDCLSKSGLGCWRRKSKTILELIISVECDGLNLRTCSVEDLESIYGIGPKTARCFILHSRKNARVAGLDTHVLKFMKEKGYDVPKSTPTKKKYKILEQQFLKLCDEAGKDPATYDLEIWNSYAK